MKIGAYIISINRDLVGRFLNFSIQKKYQEVWNGMKLNQVLGILTIEWSRKFRGIFFMDKWRILYIKTERGFIKTKL